LLFRARDHRGLDGDRPAGNERRRTRLRAEAPAEDAGGETFLGIREEWATALRLKAFEAKPLSG
jgi:hypothetical protein